MSPLETVSVWVQKFGGTSVATPDLMRNAVRCIGERRAEGDRVVVVVSAMGDTTDRLLAMAHELARTPDRRELDVLLSAGEVQSMALLVLALHERGIPAVSMSAAQGGIFTDDCHSQARIQRIESTRIQAALARGQVVVVAGFQGVTADSEITTLGRGGSDTTAVAVAAALGARCCEILTDVPGVYTADPRRVPAARHIERLSCDEMLEMATYGARVLHNRAVDLAARYEVPLLVASATEPGPGSWITNAGERGDAMEAPNVRAVTEDAGVRKISLLRVPDRPGIASDVFARLGQAGIPVRLVVQAQSHDGHNDITLIVPAELPVDRPVLDDLVRAVGGDGVLVDEEVGLLSVIGEGIAGAPGVPGRIFGVLAEEGINIDLISSSNLVITCVVPTSQLAQGARALHAALIESEPSRAE